MSDAVKHFFDASVPDAVKDVFDVKVSASDNSITQKQSSTNTQMQTVTQMQQKETHHKDTQNQKIRYKTGGVCLFVQCAECATKSDVY